MKLIIPYIPHHSVPVEIDKYKGYRFIKYGAHTIFDI